MGYYPCAVTVSLLRWVQEVSVILAVVGLYDMDKVRRGFKLATTVYLEGDWESFRSGGLLNHAASVVIDDALDVKTIVVNAQKLLQYRLLTLEVEAVSLSAG